MEKEYEEDSCESEEENLETVIKKVIDSPEIARLEEKYNFKIEGRKIDPKTMQLLMAFEKALGLDKEEQLEKFPSKEGKASSMKAKDALQRFFGIELDYKNNDIVEVALFKAIMKTDQAKFSELIKKKPDLIVKDYAMNFAFVTACSTRDIDMVKFLLQNKIDPKNIISFDCSPGYMLNASVLNAVFNDVICKNGTKEQDELFEIILPLINLESLRDGETEYSSIVEGGPEELAIELVPKIKDVNKILYNLSYSSQENYVEKSVELNTYLSIATYENKLDLAMKLLEKGAELKVDKFDFGYQLLCNAIVHKRYDICLIMAEKGVDFNQDFHYCYCPEGHAKNSPREYFSAPSIFYQLMTQAPEDVLIKIINSTKIDLQKHPMSFCQKGIYYFNKDITSSYLDYANEKGKRAVAALILEKINNEDKDVQIIGEEE